MPIVKLFWIAQMKIWAMLVKIEGPKFLLYASLLLQYSNIMVGIFILPSMQQWNSGNLCSDHPSLQFSHKGPSLTIWMYTTGKMFQCSASPQFEHEMAKPQNLNLCRCPKHNICLDIQLVQMVDIVRRPIFEPVSFDLFVLLCCQISSKNLWNGPLWKSSESILLDHKKNLILWFDD